MSTLRFHPDDIKNLAKEIATELMKNQQPVSLKQESISKTQTFKVSEAAKILNVSKVTVQSHIRKKLIKATKIGKSWIITQQSLDDYINGTNILS